jgi:hypothetical protein
MPPAGTSSIDRLPSVDPDAGKLSGAGRIPPRAPGPTYRCDHCNDGLGGDGEALKACWSFCEPDYCGILRSVPAGNAIAAGMVESISYQACGSVSCAELLTLAT